MKKIFYSLILVNITSLSAMEGRPLDKSLISLNEVLNQLDMTIGGQPIIIGEKTINLKPKQFDVLKNEKSENFSSYIAGQPEPAEGEEATIFLPPNVDPESFNYLADWQATKSKLNTLKDDLIINMMTAANALGMDKVIDILSSTFAQRHKAALYANPQVWWNNQNKELKLSDLPNELQVKLSEQLFPDINRMLFEQAKIEISNIKTNAFFFQPGKFVNLAVSLLKERAQVLEPSWNVGMVYKNNGEFTLSKIPKCYPCILQKEKFKKLGWSPNGEFLLISQSVQSDDEVQARLFHWNQSAHTWELAEKFPKVFGHGISWSPDSKYIVVSHGRGNVQVLTFVYYDFVNIKQTQVELVDFGALAWSYDSKYCAFSSKDKGLTIQERDKDDLLNTIFNKKFDKHIAELAWQPSSATLILRFDDNELQVWKKGDNKNEWLYMQTLEPAIERVVKYFIKWSPNGRYLFMHLRVFLAVDRKSYIWQEEGGKWVKNAIEPNLTKNIKDIYWSNNKLILLFGPDPDMTHLQVWQQENDTWHSLTIPFNKPMVDWDVLYDTDGSFRLLGTIDESGIISLWNLSLLDKKFYFRLDQIVPLIDWSNKVKRGEKVSLPEEFKKLSTL